MPDGRRLLLLTAGLFGALAVGVLLAGVLPGDAWARDALLAHAPPAIIGIMRWVNYAGNWRILVPATTLLVLLFPRIRRGWWIWLAMMIVAPLLEASLKELIGRARPEGTAFGFPSGHATAAAAYFGALIYAAGDLGPAARRLLRGAAACMIVLVALARVVLRAHWPSDVLGGIALGLGCVAAAVLISATIHRSPAAPMSPAARSHG